MRLCLRPGIDSLEDHDELQPYTRVGEAIFTLELILCGCQDETCTCKQGVGLNWTLSFFDDLKLAENIC